MISESTVSHFVETHSRISIGQPGRVADRYLNKITLLQAKLNIEEKKLRTLLQRYGVKILDFYC